MEISQPQRGKKRIEKKGKGEVTKKETGGKSEGQEEESGPHHRLLSSILKCCPSENPQEKGK